MGACVGNSKDLASDESRAAVADSNIHATPFLCVFTVDIV